MTNEQQQVKEWMQQFGQETPEKPTIPSLEIRKLRAKLILEEALETIEGLGFSVSIRYNQQMIKDGKTFYTTHIEDHYTPNLTLIADGCEDLKVVTEGTLVACGLVDNNINDFTRPPTDPLFDEVMLSNNSKMWSNGEVSSYFGCRVLDNLQVACKEGYYFAKRMSDSQWLVKDPSGKVIKSPSYSSANLQPIIDEMSK